MRPSYSAMLFVVLNSSLVAYFVRRPDGAIKMAEALAPKCPHDPSIERPDLGLRLWVLMCQRCLVYHKVC